MKNVTMTLLLFSASICSSAVAKGGGHHVAAVPGTGSTPSSTTVHGYTKKDGTHVEQHKRSTPDEKFENNWTTKGNENLSTGKDGSRVTEPAKKK
jgi:hypothetical protein